MVIVEAISVSDAKCMCRTVYRGCGMGVTYRQSAAYYKQLK